MLLDTASLKIYFETMKQVQDNFEKTAKKMKNAEKNYQSAARKLQSARQ